jgi:hypothetical protein
MAEAASDVGTAGAERLICLTMSRAKGAADVAAAWVEAGTYPEDALDLLRLYMSPPLAAQTIPAGTTFCHAVGVHGSADEDALRLHGFIYLWRPGVGFVARLLAEPEGRTGACTPDQGTASGATPIWRLFGYVALTEDVEVRLRDRIVFEAWSHYISDDPSAGASFSLHVDGTDDSQEEGYVWVTPDCASYLESSQDLVFADDLPAIDPDNLLVGPRELLVDGSNVGGVIGGTSLEIEETVVEQRPDRQMGPERVDVTGRALILVLHIEEATLENLRIAWGLPASALRIEDGITYLDLGEQTERPVHSLEVRGRAPGVAMTRVITVWRASIREAVGHDYSRRDATVYEARFLALNTPTRASAQRYMEIRDEPGAFEFDY